MNRAERRKKVKGTHHNAYTKKYHKRNQRRFALESLKKQA